jgi:ornithine cyclodeaminase
MESLSAYFEKGNKLGIKVLNSRFGNPKKGLPLIYASILLFDPEDGSLLCIMDGGALTAARTAAGSAVATRHLSRKESHSCSIIGTGRQGRTHLRSISAVRNITSVSIYDIDGDAALRFEEEMEAELGIPITVHGSVREAVAEADIIALCTTSDKPVLYREWVGKGVHINSIASYSPDICEIDSSLVHAARVFTDSREEALHGAGDLLIPIEEGLFTEEHLAGEIGEVCAGTLEGRTSPDQITLYKSMGLAIQDVAAAYYIYQRAREQKKGEEIAL